jgi:hypothetical protein
MTLRAAPRTRSAPLHLATVLLAAWLPTTTNADDDPRRHVQFVEEPTGTCVSRNGMQIQVRNTHPTRALRVWLDRTVMGVGSGDRSRTVLRPGADPEPLGCSRNLNGPQEWRIVRAEWVD